MYRLVERYAASYKAGDASDVSAAHCAEVLNRILQQPERDHGVKVGENALSGLTPPCWTIIITSSPPTVRWPRTSFRTRRSSQNGSAKRNT